MPFDLFGANDITLDDIENFLKGDGVAPPAADTNGSTPGTQTEEVNANKDGKDTSGDTTINDDKKASTETQAFAHRLKEETTKARIAEREAIAKSLGFESYDALLKSKETNIVKESGLDPEDVSPVVDKIIQARLQNDPRLKELEEYRQEKIKTWAQKELAELKDLTGGKISKIEDVPKNVVELWKKKGSLKAAFLELEGEKLIREARLGAAGGQSKGSTGHLATPNSSPEGIADNRRFLTDEEKRVYLIFNPGTSAEVLAKLTKEK